MSFISFGFLVFTAAVALAYFLVPMDHRWIVLLAASYVFFWLNSEWLVVFLFVSTLIAFLAAKGIHRINQNSKAYLKEKKASLTSEEKKQYKAKTKRNARLALAAGIVPVLGILLYLKYYSFFAQNANRLLSHLHVQLPAFRLLLPLGISFYTLQAIAYLVDVYRGKIEPDKSLLRFMLFMSFFPQIVQGPIPRYDQLAGQLFQGHAFDPNRAVRGAMLVLWGVIKKTVIADRISIPVTQLFSHPGDYSGSVIFLMAMLYGFQVYADFSGGMDIARGVSQILGIELELNFRQPYFSASIGEFWRRWHITLGGWMRDYVFYPISLSRAFTRLSRFARSHLGDNFGRKLPSCLAMFIVFFLVGIWHGSNWKYIAFGAWNGIFISAGILLHDQYDRLRECLRINASSRVWRVFQFLRTFLICSVGRYFPRAESVRHAFKLIRSSLVRWYDLRYLTDSTLLGLKLNAPNWILLAVGILVLLAVDYLHEKDVQIREAILKQNAFVRWIVICAAVFAVLLFGVYGSAYDKANFIYAQY